MLHSLCQQLTYGTLLNLGEYGVILAGFLRVAAVEALHGGGEEDVAALTVEAIGAELVPGEGGRKRSKKGRAGWSHKNANGMGV